LDWNHSDFSWHSRLDLRRQTARVPLMAEKKSSNDLLIFLGAGILALILLWKEGLLSGLGIGAASATTAPANAATAAGVSATSNAGSAGGVGLTGYGFPSSVYTPTQADVNSICAQFTDCTNQYVVQDTNASYTLAQAMQKALATLLICCYVGDGYCVNVAGGAAYNYLWAVPAGASTTGLGTLDQINAGQTVSSTQVAEDISENLVQTIPVVGQVIGQIANVVTGFLNAHHAQAVELENSILCALIPILNGFYTQILANLQNGIWTPAQCAELAVQVQSQAHTAIAQDSASGALHAIGEEVDAITAMYQLIAANSA
jgi:hypothetical protein